MSPRSTRARSDSEADSLLAKTILSCLAATLVITCVINLIGPGDIHRLDQPRTVSYTVDMVMNGRWFLPRDIEGRLATKPPLINWFTAPLIEAGWHDQFAFWLPVMAAHLVTVALMVWWAATLWQGGMQAASSFARVPLAGFRASPEISYALGGLAGLIYLASPYTAMLPTYVRPDSLGMPLLIGSWQTATLLLQRIAENDSSGTPKATPAHRKRVFPLCLLFWLLVGFLALTKAVPALYPVVYLLLAAKLLHGRLSLVMRTGWWWGLPLAIGLFLLWAIPAYCADTGYFLKGLIGQETLGRFTGIRGIFGGRHEIAKGPLDLLTTSWRIPCWFIDHLAPMSILCVLGICLTGAWRRDHVLWPALLWLLVTLALPLFSAGKAAQYILPCAAPAAVLGTAALRPWVETRAVAFGAAAFLALGAFAFTASHQFLGAAAKYPTARNLQIFAREASRRVAGEPVVFVATGYNSLKPLMGWSQPGAPSEATRIKARWIVAPRRLASGLHAELSSGPVYIDPTEDALEGLDSVFLLRAESVPPDHPLRAGAPGAIPPQKEVSPP